jgi:hypothetical protein
MPRLRQWARPRRSLLLLKSTVDEAKEDRTRPFWNAFAAGIEAEERRREALLDRRMERTGSRLESLE